MNEIIRFAWARFGIITGVIGEIQGRAIVTIFYYTILVPFGLGSRLLSDPLRFRRPENSTPHWIERSPVGATLEDAREQG